METDEGVVYVVVANQDELTALEAVGGRPRRAKSDLEEGRWSGC